MNIYDKIFTYIESKSALNTLGTDVLKQYENSLIFIGDQKQIYQPLTNTYVGIGQDEFNRLENIINQSGNNLIAFNSYIHKDVVTHIYGQYSESELGQLFVEFSNNGISGTLVGNNPDNNVISSQNYKRLTSTNRNVVIKGFYDYDPSAPYSNTYHDVNITSNGIYNYVRNKTGNVYSYGSSGINIKVQHTGSWRTSGPTDEYPYGFSYWDGQDILTIDDKLTWAYIGQNISYLKNYARTIAAEEANRIYHNLLGEDVVYISKNLDNILYYDSDTGAFDIAQNNVYVKVEDNTTTVGYRYDQVSYEEDINYPGTYLIKLGNVVLGSYDPVTGGFDVDDNVESNLNDINIKLSENDGWVRDITTNNIIDIIFYTEDPAQTSPFNYNLADGIQTIKEVAYILDTITDGDGDDGISIAYNIKQNHEDIINLQNWQNTVNDPTTSNFVTSFASKSNESNFIILNSYSSSQADETKGDIKLYGDLILAYTYMIGDISYAAYTTGQIDGNKYVRYIDYLNFDDNSNYVCITDSSNGNNSDIRINAGKKLSAAGYSNNTEFILYFYNSSTGKYYETPSHSTETLSTILNTDSTNINVDNNAVYIFLPFKEQEIEVNSKGVLDGITTVDWVTTYVGHGLNDLSKKLNEGNEGANQYTDQQLGYLDATYIAPTGKYISKIIQTDGLISEVDYTNIPQDIIYTDSIIANEDDFIQIPYNIARNYKLAGTPDIYFINSGVYTNVGNNLMDESTQYYIKTALPTDRFVDVRELDFTPTELTDLIGSGYNFFKKKANTGDKDIYVPVDLQEEIKNIINATTSGTPDLTLANNQLYYIDFTEGTRFTKYISGFTSIGPDGHTNININAYISYLSTSNENNTGLADAYDIRKTIERLFTWIDLSTNADFVRATA